MKRLFDLLLVLLRARGVQLTVVGKETRADFDLDWDGQYDDGFLVVSSVDLKVSDFFL